MAYGPEGISPDYAYQSAMQGRNQPGLAAQIGKHAFGSVLGGLGGAIGAYGVRQNILQQQQAQQEQQQQKPSPNALPQVGINQQPIGVPQQGSNDQLAALLQQLTSQKVDQMTARREMGAQPQMLQKQAFDASNQQMGQQGPPVWGKQQPGFAFDQYTGQGGEQFNPLSVLGDLASGAAEETDQEQPWWRQGLHGIGKLATGAAPIAGMLGPWGMAAGAGLGALGYLAQQV